MRHITRMIITSMTFQWKSTWLLFNQLPGITKNHPGLLTDGREFMPWFLARMVQALYMLYNTWTFSKSFCKGDSFCKSGITRTQELCHFWGGGGQAWSEVMGEERVVSHKLTKSDREWGSRARRDQKWWRPFQAIFAACGQSKSVWGTPTKRVNSVQNHITSCSSMQVFISKIAVHHWLWHYNVNKGSFWVTP